MNKLCACKSGCKYISKVEAKEYKKEIEQVIQEVKKDVKNEFKKSFNHHIVGSSKRNLIVQKGDSQWDIDYQFIFLANIFQEIEPKFLKTKIKNLFELHLKKIKHKKYSVNFSNSVITINELDPLGSHSKKSFDIALIKYNKETKNKEILRGKSDDKSSKHYFRWEELPKTRNVDLPKIQGKEEWKKFREFFLKKKCSNMEKQKNEQKPTFSLYIESIYEVKQ